MTDRALAPRYHGVPMALLTQHGKEYVMAPLFAERLEVELRLARGFDTDRFGTFTRDVKRPGDQRVTALAKARMGAELTGLPLGVASEGSFVPGPLGLYVRNLELVVLVDCERRREFVGRFEAITQGVMAAVHSIEELERLTANADFPTCALVLRPNGGDDPRARKGIDSHAALLDAFHEMQRLSTDGMVFVESDYRAHQNPPRMQNIARATEDLISRLRTCCSRCHEPGFGQRGVVRGLPCADCGEATRCVRAEELACLACDYVEVRPLGRLAAEPTFCDACNP